jgi:hypothetical protein
VGRWAALPHSPPRSTDVCVSIGLGFELRVFLKSLGDQGETSTNRREVHGTEDQQQSETKKNEYPVRRFPNAESAHLNDDLAAGMPGVTLVERCSHIIE